MIKASVHVKKQWVTKDFDGVLGAGDAGAWWMGRKYGCTLSPANHKR